MFLKHLTVAAIATCALAFAPAQAAVPACSFTDLTGVTVTGCAGFYEGNLISGNADSQATVASILSGLGLSGNGSWIEKLEIGSGSTIDFSVPLSGTTIIGIHVGNGAFPSDQRGKGGGTAFYAFDAGTSLDSFGVSLQGLSNAAVYATAPVPEPETYALMLAGLAAVGVMARRRKRA